MLQVTDHICCVKGNLAGNQEWGFTFSSEDEEGQM